MSDEAATGPEWSNDAGADRGTDRRSLSDPLGRDEPAVHGEVAGLRHVGVSEGGGPRGHRDEPRPSAPSVEGRADPLVALERIKADTQRRKTLAEQATPGPWSALTSGVASGDHWYVCDEGEAIASIASHDGSNEEQRPRDAAHIAANDPASVIAACDGTIATAEFLGEQLERHVWLGHQLMRGCNTCGQSDKPCGDRLAALALIAQLNGGTT